MTLKEIISGLKFTIDMFLSDPYTGRKVYTEPRNYLDKITVDACKGAIELLEQTRWIPVETALPEVGSEVLVCYEFKKHRSVYIADFYGDGKFHGLDDEYLTTEGRKYRKAVAWMPMPTPPNKSEIPTGAERSDKK